MLVHVFKKESNSIVDNGICDWTEEEITFDPSVWACVPPQETPKDWANMTVENGQLVPASPELIAERQAIRQAKANKTEIEQLRAYLTQTDYAAIKCGELGLSMAETYPDLHTARTVARTRINELQEGGAE